MFRKLKLGLVALMLFLTSGWTPPYRTSSYHHKEACIGYTIIEFGKAIDCHGDTIRLVRKNGLQVFEAHLDNNQNNFEK